MNKKLILIPALLLALTSCGPTTSAPTDPTVPTEPSVSEPTTAPSTPDPTDPSVEAPVVTSITITNKEDLTKKWNVGEDDRNVSYQISYSDGSTAARGATISSSDLTVISLPGGVKIHAAGKGTATITVTAGDFSDSVEITVTELSKEETVTVAELLEKPVNDATAYIVTGYIVAWQSGKSDATAYGNFYLADNAEDGSDKGILVYGATEHEDSLKYDEATKTWSWGNPNSEDPKRPFPLADYKIGDKVTMKGLRLDYGSTVEFNGVVTDHEKVQAKPVESIEFKNKVTSLGNGYSYTLKAQDNNGDEAVTYTITGDAATLDGSTLVASETKTGTVTITATSTVNEAISASIDVEIVATPAIVDATLEEVINDEGVKGAKLFRVTVKTQANSSTSDSDTYGNFDYTDGTNTITSYGLSVNPSSISFYNNVWNFKNDKTFKDTGIEVGSDKEYTVIVMRSDYQGTKQLVGYLEKEYSENIVETTVEGLIAASVSTRTAYAVKGYIVGYQYDTSTDAGAYGNIRIADSMDSETNILVYGCTEDASKLSFDKKTGEYAFTSGKNFNPDNYMIGDYVELKVLRTEYKETAQCNGIITKHEYVRPEFVSLIGSFNDWAADVDFKTENSKVWTLDGQELAANAQIKIRMNHRWSTAEEAGYDWGYANVVSGKDLINDNSGNIEIKEEGTYNFSFNFETKAISIAKIVIEEGSDSVTFDFGANAAATHVDGNDLGASKSYTAGGYTLKLENMSKVYGPAYDAKGNSCLKLGTSKLVGSFSFAVPEDITSVTIFVAKYKANDTKVSVNGTNTTLTKNSNDGAYDEIVIDTTTTKTISFATVATTYRCMINTIVFSK